MNRRNKFQLDQQIPEVSEFIKTSSLTTLIVWNIKKALEQNPKLELKPALKAAQKSLELSDAVSVVISQRPERRHLSCALLAWQQMGHIDSDSLHSFVMAQMKVDQQKQSYKSIDQCWNTSDASVKTTHNKSYNAPVDRSFISYQESEIVESPLASGIIGSLETPSFAMGPVFRLPVTPKSTSVYNTNTIPVFNAHCTSCGAAGKKDTKDKLAKDCSLHKTCAEKLEAQEKETREMRNRLAKLAKRESERIELLERAEMAWKDLEIGYTRRLKTCIENEKEILEKSTQLIGERNNNKETCEELEKSLKSHGDTLEKIQTELKNLEKSVCCLACDRLKLKEMVHKESVILTDTLCKCNQQDQDFAFKQEQTHRKKLTVENELELTRGLLFEQERTLKAELKGFKDQINDVSKELFEENAIIENLKKERDSLLQEKNDLTEDLEGCQLICDKNMQKKVDELKTKREKLKALKEKVLECKCKFPMETGVQVQRTPSFAAICHCTPQERALKSCSCTSLRSSLLSNLFTNLFAGLQTEMGETSIKMPCQLLKCLDDSHNWDSASVTKTNLRSFFAKLLCGELEIAIINSIERYHAQWIGASCADFGKPIPDLGPEIKNWEDRALAHKAKWMAQSMAEEMFKEKVEQIMEQAKKVVSSGPPPCTCKPPQPGQNAAVFQCLIEPVNDMKLPIMSSSPNHILHEVKSLIDIGTTPEMEITPVTDVEREVVSVSTNTRKRISPKVPQRNETLQKEMVHRTRPCYECSKSDVVLLRAQIESLKKESLKKEDMKYIEQKIKLLVQRASGPDEPQINNEKKSTLENNKTNVPKHSAANIKTKKKKNTKDALEKININRHYAVNMCLCGTNRSMSKSEKQQLTVKSNENNPKTESLISAIRINKPIDNNEPLQDKLPTANECAIVCGSNCCCFNKNPSCTSIVNFLDKLTEWKYDMNSFSGITNPNFNLIIGCDSKKSNEPVSKNDLKSLGKQSNSNITVVKDDHESVFKMPATTESEYMGAVNLEKSDEDINKTLNLDHNNIQNKISYNSIKPSIKIPEFKVNISEINNVGSIKKRKIKSEEYPKEVVEIVSKKKTRSHEAYSKKKTENNLFQSKIVTKKVSPCKQDKIKKREMSKPVPSLLLDENHKKNQEISSNTSIKQDLFTFVELNNLRDRCLNTADDLKCGCEHQIKLLGVTLANPIMNRKNSHNFQEVTDNNEYLIETKQDQKLKENLLPSVFVGPLKSTGNCDSLRNEKANVGVSASQVLQCQCSVKFDELKDLLNNANNSKKVVLATEDKSFDTNSINNISKDYDNCVCCNNCAEECEEIEVNMFHLLKEHFRKKIDGFKNTCESSYCIKPDEENKIITEIFKKIKQTVTESTGKVICKCSSEANEGSWQRAYKLLQEYLKIKISRVKCSCSSSDQNNEHIILPELTDKVCLLIEKDFERLKDVCKYKHEQKYATPKSSLNEETKLHTPEKDFKDYNSRRNINNSEMNVYNSESKNLSKCHAIITYNISAQVIPSFTTKSCETIKQPVEITSNVETQYSNVSDETAKKNSQTISLETIDMTGKTSMLKTNNFIKECCQLEKSYSTVSNLSIKKVSVSHRATSIEDEQIHCSLVSQVLSNPDNLSDCNKIKVGLKPNENINEKLKTKSLPYIGYTINCNCTPNLGFCVCPRSKVIDNSEYINELWVNNTKNKTSNLNNSYIMNSIDRNKNYSQNPPHVTTPPKINETLYFSETSYFISHIESSNDDCFYKTAPEGVVISDIDTNTRSKVIFTLKDSKETLSKQYTQYGTNTTKNKKKNQKHKKSKINSVGSFLKPQPKNSTRVPYEKKSVHFLHCSKSENDTTLAVKNSSSNYPNCNCSKVPVCHIKMLVNDIETKLANLECTCDSLSPKVCPVHGKNND